MRQPAAALDADGGLLRTPLCYYSHGGNDSFPWGERYVPMVGIRAKSVSGERRVGFGGMQRQPRAYYNFSTTDWRGSRWRVTGASRCKGSSVGVPVRRSVQG